MKALRLLVLVATGYPRAMGSDPTAAVKVREIGEYEYVGCYSTHENGRRNALPFASDGPGTNSVDGCQAACKNGGYTYAGLEGGAECQCGNEITPGSPKVSDKQCDTPCRGDPSQICGGRSRMSMYGRHLTRRDTAESTNYEGCIEDPGNPRTLHSDYYHDDEKMTTESCIAYCKDGNYAYAGLEYARECFCGDSPEQDREFAPEADCNMACTGDSTEMCGGSSRLSLYSIDYDMPSSPNPTPQKPDPQQQNPSQPNPQKPDPQRPSPHKPPQHQDQPGHNKGGRPRSHHDHPRFPRPFHPDRSDHKKANETHRHRQRDISDEQYDGCFTDSDLRMLSGGHFHDAKGMTAEKCCSYCRRGSWKLAALKSSSDCYCGNSEYPKKNKAPEAECDTKCIGDASQSCGGTNRLSLYNLGDYFFGQDDPSFQGQDQPHMIKKPIEWSFGGCYRDENKARILPYDGTGESGPEPLTIERCCNTCHKNKFSVVGIKNGNECHCGHELMNDPKLVPSAQCSKPCLGKISDELCGNQNTMSIWTKDPNGLVHIQPFQSKKGKGTPPMQCSCKEKTRKKLGQLLTDL